MGPSFTGSMVLLRLLRRKLGGIYALLEYGDMRKSGEEIRLTGLFHAHKRGGRKKGWRRSTMGSDSYHRRQLLRSF